MSKINIDTLNVESTITLLDDIISIYNSTITKLDNAFIPYNFSYKYAYRTNISSLQKDRNALNEFRSFIKDSIKDLNELDEALLNQAKTLPSNPVKAKDFSL